MGGNRSGRRLSCTVSGRGGCPPLAPIRQCGRCSFLQSNEGVGYTLMSSSVATHP